jgi:hypothetical protein
MHSVMPGNVRPAPVAHTCMQMVASEYATRYLEQIGVKPSKGTLDMVHKNIPLSPECVKTTLRVRGGRLLALHPLDTHTHTQSLSHAHTHARAHTTNHSCCPPPSLRTQSQGHVQDEVQISVPPVVHTVRVPQKISAHSIVQLGMANTSPEGSQPLQAGAKGPLSHQQLAEASANGSLEEEPPEPNTLFRQLVVKYLHPFNLEANMYAGLKFMATKSEGGR